MTCGTAFSVLTRAAPAAALFGLGKMFHDLKKTQPVAHIKQPWEGR